MTTLQVAIIVGPTVYKSVVVYSAWAATSVINGKPVADEKFNFGYKAGETGRDAIANLKEHLACFPVELEFVLLNQLPTITLH